MGRSYDINSYPIEVEELEARMRCLHDTKKELIYDKHSGTWYWCDKGER